MACFRSVSKHLTEARVFLIKASVPDLSRFDNDQTVRVIHLGEDEVRLDVARAIVLRSNKSVPSMYCLPRRVFACIRSSYAMYGRQSWV